MPLLAALAVALLVISLVLFLLETVLYLAYVGWYFRLGPALLSHQWQTNATPEAALAAVDQARRTLKLGSRRKGDLFLLRDKWWSLSVWFRLSLRVVPGPHGAIIRYQARPFVTPVLVALGVLMLVAYSRMQLLTLGYFMVIVLIYVAGGAWEYRRLRSHRTLRRQLASLGLSVCSTCGYDRFGLAQDAACPECGGREDEASGPG